MKAQRINHHKLKMITKVLRLLADNPRRGNFLSLSQTHSNRWGTTSWS